MRVLIDVCTVYSGVFTNFARFKVICAKKAVNVSLTVKVVMQNSFVGTKEKLDARLLA